jgi:hypothetical protein
MREQQNTVEASEAPAATSWKPAFEVISLACEISAYAPDDGGPLF